MSVYMCLEYVCECVYVSGVCVNLCLVSNTIFTNNNKNL